MNSQTTEWSDSIRKQELEQHEIRIAHIKEEYEMLRKLMLDAQRTQMIGLKTRLDAESKELKQMQTKKSMDDSRAIMQEKTIKTKAERDRRVKELNEKNLKLFVEERKRLAIKYGRYIY